MVFSNMASTKSGGGGGLSDQQTSPPPSAGVERRNRTNELFPGLAFLVCTRPFRTPLFSIPIKIF